MKLFKYLSALIPAVAIPAACFTTTSCNRVDYSQYTLGVIGDSIAWGSSPKTGIQMDSPFPVALKNYIGFGHCCNCGVGSSTISSGDGSYAPICNRVDGRGLSYQCSIVIIWAGVNDWKNGCTLGEAGDTETTTFYGALESVCSQLSVRRETYDAFVMFMTPLPMRAERTGIEDYINAMKYECNKYDIPILDMYTDSGFESEWAHSWSDGLHPSQSYIDNIAVPKVTKFIKQNLNK